MREFSTHSIAAGDRDDWRTLFRDYGACYGTAVDNATADRVWRWLLDRQVALDGLLARDERSHAVGLAHVQARRRPLHGDEAAFLEDLYVAPEARGRGAADALFAGLRALARARGWPSVRWLTETSNARARGLYDRMAGGASDFVVYDWQPD